MSYKTEFKSLYYEKLHKTMHYSCGKHCDIVISQVSHCDATIDV